MMSAYLLTDNNGYFMTLESFESETVLRSIAIKACNNSLFNFIKIK